MEQLVSFLIGPDCMCKGRVALGASLQVVTSEHANDGECNHVIMFSDYLAAVLIS